MSEEKDPSETISEALPQLNDFVCPNYESWALNLFNVSSLETRKIVKS
jgi:hypothetical protein